MSSERGNIARTRPQKHKNRHVFKNDLHDKTPQQKLLNSLHISEVCQHCKSVIEWKIKYKKYKPLSQPKTCTKCSQKKIRKAYHVLCRECALDAQVCAKCLKSAEDVQIEPPQPTPEEELKLKVEMEKLIKSFPERKRRAFLRYMDKGKTEKAEVEEIEENERDCLDKEVKVINDENIKIRFRVPHTRDELLLKIEQLKDDDYNGLDSDDNCDEGDKDNDSDEQELSDASSVIS